MSTLPDENANEYYSDYWHLLDRPELLDSYIRRATEDVSLQHLARYLKGCVVSKYPVHRFRRYLRGTPGASTDTQLRHDIVTDIDFDTISKEIRLKISRMGFEQHPTAVSIYNARGLKQKLLTNDIFFNRVFEGGFTLSDVWITPN